MAIDRITTQSITAGAITAAKVAGDMATQAELDTISTVASAALPKAGGAISGNLSFSNTSQLSFGRGVGIASLDYTDASDAAIFVTAAQTTNYFQPLIGVGEGSGTFTAAISSVDTGASAAQGLVFHTGDTNSITERMRIHSGGGVSIGVTTEPGNGGLIVSNDIKTNSRLGIGSTGNLSTPAIYLNSDTNTGIYFPAANKLGVVTGGVERIHIDSAGKVGIGVTSPLGMLHAQTLATGSNANSVYILRGPVTNELPSSIDTQTSLVLMNREDTWSNGIAVLSAPTGTSYINFGDTADENIGAVKYMNNGDKMLFRTNASDNMVIDSTGKVGIGTGTPGNSHAKANLLVVGSGSAGGIGLWTGTNDGGYYFSRANSNDTDSYDGGMSYDGSRNLKFHTNAGATRLTINGSGNATFSGTISATATATLLIINSAGSTVKTINGIG